MTTEICIQSTQGAIADTLQGPAPRNIRLAIEHQGSFGAAIIKTLTDVRNFQEPDLWKENPSSELIQQQVTKYLNTAQSYKGAQPFAAQVLTNQREQMHWVLTQATEQREVTLHSTSEFGNRHIPVGIYDLIRSIGDKVYGSEEVINTAAVMNFCTTLFNFSEFTVIDPSSLAKENPVAARVLMTFDLLSLVTEEQLSYLLADLDLDPGAVDFVHRRLFSYVPEVTRILI